MQCNRLVNIRLFLFTHSFFWMILSPIIRIRNISIYTMKRGRPHDPWVKILEIPRKIMQWMMMKDQKSCWFTQLLHARICFMVLNFLWASHYWFCTTWPTWAGNFIEVFSTYHFQNIKVISFNSALRWSSEFVQNIF